MRDGAAALLRYSSNRSGFTPVLQMRAIISRRLLVFRLTSPT
jgi:hypothetical protein